VDTKNVRLTILISLFAASLLAQDGSDVAARLYNRTEYSAAVKVLTKAPANETNLALLGQSWFMLGDFSKSTDALEKAAALAPQNSMIQTWLGRAWGRRAETSFALKAFGYASKTRQSFERALQLNPANTEALGDLFDYYIEAPGIVGGGMDKAAGLLPAFAKYDPVGGYLAQARIDEKKKQFDNAESSLRRAIACAPRQAGLVIALAQFFSRQGRYDESERLFQQAANLAPDSPRILFAQADSNIKAQRNIDQARSLLKQYLAAGNLTPNDPPRWEALHLLKKAEGS